ncbi:molybdopterin-dependent oxidoreductase [Streptomyces sp. NPDC058783]|uniref:molybdopterin-dependent oxidoreductase n=1 Tax=Streptomyces sp. NPDC058783 TaxID=3346633 RepID=UPI0036BAF947
MPLPHWSPPTNANEIFRYAEQGSVGFLWIAGTTPAVSMPDLARICRILSGDQCFVVVSDGHRTETTELADAVLPAALWAEKTGTFTNVDRTVHLQEKAVEPPPARPGATRPSSPTTPVAWASPTRTATPCRPGTPRSRPSRHGRRPAPGGPATTPASPTASCTTWAASSGPAPTGARRH